MDTFNTYPRLFTYEGKNHLKSILCFCHLILLKRFIPLLWMFFFNKSNLSKPTFVTGIFFLHSIMWVFCFSIPFATWLFLLWSVFASLFCLDVYIFFIFVTQITLAINTLLLSWALNRLHVILLNIRTHSFSLIRLIMKTWLLIMWCGLDLNIRIIYLAKSVETAANGDNTDTSGAAFMMSVMMAVAGMVMTFSGWRGCFEQW